MYQRPKYSGQVSAFDALIASFAKEYEGKWFYQDTTAAKPQVRAVGYYFDDKDDADDFVKALELRTKGIRGTVRKSPEDKDN